MDHRKGEGNLGDPKQQGVLVLLPFLTGFVNEKKSPECRTNFRHERLEGRQ